MQFDNNMMNACVVECSLVCLLANAVPGYFAHLVVGKRVTTGGPFYYNSRNTHCNNGNNTNMIPATGNK